MKLPFSSRDKGQKQPRPPRKPFDLGASVRTRSFRVGGYSVAAAAIVLAIAVAVNVLVGALPDSMTQIDTTSSQLFTISDQTEQLVAGLEEEKEELEEVVNFCVEMGLPTTLCDLGLHEPKPEQLMEAARLACAETDTMGHLPFPVSPEKVYDAILAADEIGGEEDLRAVEYAATCGCRLLATIHGRSVGEIRRKPLFERILGERIFERFVILGGERAGLVREIADEAGRILWRRDSAAGEE